MAKKSLRVDMPRKAGELLTLAAKIYNKHEGDGVKSPLNTLQDYSWDKIGPTVQTALAQHNLAEDLRLKMEQAFGERDKYLSDVNEAVKSSRDLLLSVFKKNPKVLNEWGLSVHDSPLAKKSKVADTASK